MKLLKDKNLVKIVGSVLVSSIVLAGCGNKAAENKEVKVKDGRGKEVVMDKYADSFVLFPKEATAMFSITQTTDGFLGMNAANKDYLKGSVLAKHYPELLNIKSDISAKGTSFNPNVEEILSLKPDVVYQWHVGGKERWEPLEKADIPVITVNWGDWNDDIERYKTYAQGIGKQKRMDELLKRQDEASNKVKKVTQSIKKEEKLNHVFVDEINGNEIGVWGTVLPHTSVHGVENAAYTIGKLNKPGEKINTETLLKWNPDMIIINSTAFKSGKVTPEKIMNNSLFKNLKAVKNKKIYVVPDVSQLDNPTILWYWYAMLATPDKFEDTNLRNIVKDEYKFLYNTDINEEEVDEILNIKANKNSENYKQFIK
ncbi:ABC transporter substrate-binding protein [Clostridium oceanicum]|uniref:ABC transporter substrate-binding protein n=1 Tax=Clostridium oceanicum TaxID=1543 RepID=A0ABN1J9E1_9CLOT